MSRLLPVAVVFAALAFLPRLAHAADPPAETTVAGTTVERYPASLIAADVLSFTAIGLATHAKSDALAWVGLAGFLTAAPLIHAAHGQPTHAVGSLALRLALPVVGFALGAAAAGHDSSCEDCWLGPAFLAGGVGVLAAMVIDYTLLASKTVEPPRSSFALAVIPTVAVTPAGTAFGLAGRF